MAEQKKAYVFDEAGVRRIQEMVRRSQVPKAGAQQRRVVRVGGQ